MNSMERDKKLNYLFSVLAVAVMWAVWLIAHAIVRNEYIIPSFSDTIASIGAQLISSRFWLSFALTVWRTIYAWLLAFVLAVIFASLSALSMRFYRFFAPFIGVLRSLPTMAVTLMLLIWTTPRIAPVIVALMMLLPLTYTQLITAYKGIDPKLIEMADVYRLDKKTRLVHIYIPQMMPGIFAQAGANLSLTLKVMISAEVLSSTFRSIGGMMHDAAMYSQMAEMFAITIVMLIVGGLLEFLLGLLTRITDRWTKGRGTKANRRSTSHV